MATLSISKNEPFTIASHKKQPTEKPNKRINPGKRKAENDEKDKRKIIIKSFRFFKIITWNARYCALTTKLNFLYTKQPAITPTQKSTAIKINCGLFDFFDLKYTILFTHITPKIGCP